MLSRRNALITIGAVAVTGLPSVASPEVVHKTIKKNYGSIIRVALIWNGVSMSKEHLELWASKCDEEVEANRHKHEEWIKFVEESIRCEIDACIQAARRDFDRNAARVTFCFTKTSALESVGHFQVVMEPCRFFITRIHDANPQNCSDDPRRPSDHQRLACATISVPAPRSGG